MPLPAPPRSTLPPPPPRPVDDRRWGLGDAVLAMVIFFAVSTALAIVAFAASGGDEDAILDGPWLPIAVGVPPLVQLAYVWWVGDRKGRGWVADFGFSFRWKDLGVGAISFLVGFVAAGVIGALVFTLLDEEPTAAVAEMAEDSSGDGGLTVWLVLLAVLGATLVPVVEELVFRGLWWSALEKRGLGPWWCLVITSGLFALVHLEPIRTPVLFVLGMAIGYGRIYTGRIGASIVGHAMINSIAMTFLLVELA